MIPLTLMACESIAHSAFGLMGYWLRANLGSRNNCWLFSSKQCIIKQLLDSVFSDVLNNQGLGKCHHSQPSARLITLTSTLIILDVTKTSSNNCLLSDKITWLTFEIVSGSWLMDYYSEICFSMLFSFDSDILIF